MGRVYVIGAGLAGLSAAVRIADAGKKVTLIESAGQAGGRCRSFYDDKLERVIDNGNHLMLSGNWAVMDYVDTIGAADTLTGPSGAEFPFVDLKSNERWTVVLTPGRFPFWLFSASNRIAGTRPLDYLAIWRLLLARDNQVVADLLSEKSLLFKRFIDPLTVAVTNSSPGEAAAQLLKPVLKETFLKGSRFCRPLIARDGLSESLVNPALEYLKSRNCQIKLNCRTTEIDREDGQVRNVVFADNKISVSEHDDVILAAPPATVKRLMPEIAVPETYSPIVNLHFRLERPPRRPLPIIGLIGGTAQWLFVRGDIVSVTISAADELVNEPSKSIVDAVWSDICVALKLDSGPPPTVRVIKEKRATFRQTPEALRFRPRPRTPWSNLFLAGDWTDTGLPATIEGAVRSGREAARLVLGRNAIS